MTAPTQLNGSSTKGHIGYYSLPPGQFENSFFEILICSHEPQWLHSRRFTHLCNVYSNHFKAREHIKHKQLREKFYTWTGSLKGFHTGAANPGSGWSPGTDTWPALWEQTPLYPLGPGARLVRDKGATDLLSQGEKLPEVAFLCQLLFPNIQRKRCIKANTKAVS